MSEKIPVTIDPDIQDLVPGFLENRRKDVEKLRQMVANKAFDEIRMLGHSMKGVGGGYGFDQISEYGAEIERAALCGDGSTIRACADQLADYLARVEIVLDE